MNFKTTLVLAVVLIAMAVTYLLLPAAKEKPVSRTETAGSTAPKLLPAGLGEPKKIVVSRAGQPDWVFEAAPAEQNTSTWKMTAPVDAPVQKYMLDDIVRRLKDTGIDEKYVAGSPGAITPEAAGLAAPKVTISLTDKDDKTVKVAIGMNPSDHQSYVRLDDGKDILLTSTSLKDVAREKAADYRDQVLLSLKQNTIKTLEVVDRREGAPVTYRLVYNGKDWLFEEPFKALAVTKELTSVTQGLANVRVTEWADDTVKDFHGLATPAVTVNVTVEEPAPTPPATTEPAETQPATVLRTYTLNISAHSPIGDDTKVFVQRADNPSVGTMYKSALERFYPKVNTWRDMRLTTVPVKSATKVELTTPEGSATFEKKPEGWFFAGSGQATGPNEVQDLLDAIAALHATAFIEGDVSLPATYGLDQPRADIRLSVPAVADIERITIGGYTEPNNKLLVYARRGQANAVAKVRATDVAKLIRQPLAYRDRTIVKVAPADVQRVSISRHDAAAGQPFTFALTRADGVWAITEPAATPTDSAAVDGLVTALSDLKGSSVVAESGELATYGLDAPAVTVEMSVQSAPLGPPPPAPASQPAAGAGDESQGDGPTDDPADARSDTPPGSPDHGPAATVPPTPTTIRLLFAKKADAVYAKRDDQPVIYQIDTAVYDKLNAEYHAGGLFTFDQNQVKSVTLQSPDAGLQGFSKEGPTAWKYSVEPDLPIDANKLKNYLVQLKDLKPARYAAYSASDLATFGLDQPQYELTVTLDDGKKERMRVTAKNPTGGGHFAVMNESHDVFILPGDSLARFAIKPADFVSESTPPKVN